MFLSKLEKQARVARDLSAPHEHGVGHWFFDVQADTYQGSSECCQLRYLSSQNTVELFNSDQWWQCVDVEDRQRINQTFQQLIDGHCKTISMRYSVHNEHGLQKWILTRASVAGENTSTSKSEFISGVDIDISELHEIQQERDLLREETKRFSIALESSQQGLWQVDFGRGTRSESDTWRTMRGFPADSAYNSSNRWFQDIHPDDQYSMRCRHGLESPVIESSDTINQTYRQRNADGEWRWIWSRGKVIERNIEGKPLVLLGTDTDITEIKEVENRFERLSNTLDIAIQAAGMGVWEWTLNAQINAWDHRTLEIFGKNLHTDSVSQEEFLELVHPEDRASLEQALFVAVQNRADISVEYRIIHPQTGVRHIKANAKCQLGEPMRYVGIVWDITDTVKAEQERISLAERLSYGQRMQSIGELTGGIAHDFNNLLAIISGNAELMSITSNEKNKYLEAILTASQTGASLVRSLLAFSSRQALNPVSVKIDELLGNLSEMLPTTLTSSVTMNIHDNVDLWHCKADPVQIGNALINLIVNSRDAMPDGGSITIDTENVTLDASFASLADHVIPGDFVKVSVTDSGKGMTRDVSSKALEPFFSTKTGGKGHGLGLSMVFGFIKQSNGHITISSAPDEGTTVSLYFPRHEHHEATSLNKHNLQEHTNLPKGQGQTILLVEDDSAVQQMIKTSLEQLDYKCMCASSGEEAITKLESTDAPINLVLSDVVLGEMMNGFELGNKLSKRYPGIRLAYISGHAQDARVAQDFNEVNPEILHKPFSLEILARHIHQKLRSDNK